MQSITLDNVPDELHERLKVEAEQNRQSMPEQILAILNQALRLPASLPPLRPVKPVPTLKPIDPQWLIEAMREGRE